MTTETTETTETTDTTQIIRMTPRITLSIDRIATRASELGHAAVEAQCDRVLADMAAPSTVYEMIRGDVQYWPDRAIDRLLRDVGDADRSAADQALEDYCEAEARATMDALTTVIGPCALLIVDELRQHVRPAAEHEAGEATPNLGRQAFLVVCKDRHVDLGLSIHLTWAGAAAVAAAFQAYYGDDHAWVEESRGAPKWVRYVRSAEGDGPSAYVEISQIME